MEDSDDEFEPLFDYTRIQPRDAICIDDDSPKLLPIGRSKKQKTSNAEVEKKEEKDNVKAAVNVINCDDNEDEEDWLPPPPKNINICHKILEDSTLKALRLKKQELASFAQSAEEIVRAVEESVRKDLSASFQSSPQSASKKPLDPPPERAKILLSFQNKDEVRHLRVYMDDKFERLFKKYAQTIEIDVNKLVFLFDGDKISPTATPSSLGMEDDDIIEVHVKCR